MRNFVYKTLLFTLPFMLLYGATRLFSSTDKGDLLRMSALIDRTGDYHNRLARDFTRNDRVIILDSTLYCLPKKTNKRVLTVGDSYSLMGVRGYQNALAFDGSVEVLDFSFMQDPSAAMSYLLNQNNLDDLEVDYVVFQSVERRLPHHLEQLKEHRSKGFVQAENIPNKGYETGIFFSRRILSFALNNIFYLFNDNLLNNKVYKTDLNQKAFTTGDRSLLFYSRDLEDVSLRSSMEFALSLNAEMNALADMLKAHGIELIFMPCPDKLSFYHAHLAHPDRYALSSFFKHFSTLNKQYTYVHSWDVLKRAEQAETYDLYYWDDTHWSPVGAECMAKALKRALD